jgi:hypothetical protein
MLTNFSTKYLPPVTLRHPALAMPRSPKQLGQIVTFDPKVDFRPDVKVQAPINIELGGLPLSLGLFAGSALSFIVKGQVPAGWPQTVATLLGAGLAVGGIMNLLMPKAHAAAPAAAPSGGPSQVPTTAAPSAPGGGATAPPGMAPPARPAFDQISGRITYPGEAEQIDIWPTSSSYPIRLQLYNPSGESATFYVEIVAKEFPHPFGDEVKTTYPMQVTVGAGQTRDIDIAMPITSWGWGVDYSDIDLVVYKRRVQNEDPVRIADRFLVVE